MRLIDADAFEKVIEELLDVSNQRGNLTLNAVFSFMYVLLKKQPTISPDEARGVVHCEDCDLWNEWDCAGRKSLGNYVCSCARWTAEDGATFYTQPTDFCSYGERKEDDKDD